MSNPITKDMHATLALLIRATDNLKCTGPKAPKVSCIGDAEGKRDSEGRSLFFFGEGCTLVESFCPACRCYWHLQVARNALDTIDRVAALTRKDTAS